MPPLRQRRVQQQWPSRQAGACRPEQAVPVVAAGGAASPRSLNEVAAAQVSGRLTLPRPFFQARNWRETRMKRGDGTPKTVLTNTEVVAGRCWSAWPGPPAHPFAPALEAKSGSLFHLAKLGGQRLADDSGDASRPDEHPSPGGPLRRDRPA